jgi:hypothetical protein
MRDSIEQQSKNAPNSERFIILECEGNSYRLAFMKKLNKLALRFELQDS